MTNDSLPLNVYDISKARAVCSDNLKFLKTIQTGSIKLVVTSPPYNIGKEYEERITLEDWTWKQSKVIEECVRVLHPKGSICWEVGSYVDQGAITPLDVVLYPIFKNYSLKMRNRIVWHYGHGLHATKRLSGRYETINWWTKNDNYTWNLDDIRVPSKQPTKRHFKGPKKGQLSGNPLGKNPTDVWEIPIVNNNHPEKTDHPCQFPVELVERLVLSMTNVGDIVLDPYMGVGSTLVAAHKHGRTGWGCDTVDQYVEIATDRLQRLERGTLKTRPMGKPIITPKYPTDPHHGPGMFDGPVASS